MYKGGLIYSFSPEKNNWLKKERGISFDEIIAAIDNDMLLDVMEHPNKNKYANQNIYVVEINNYVFLVPFVEEENHVFLKTIIPSRTATKHYIGER